MYRRTPIVIVSNHASLLDIPALMHLPLSFRVVARRSIFRVPFMGWFMALSGHVRMDSEDPVGALDQCRAELAQGSSVLSFPEGTRSADGQVGRFKLGAFQLACEASVPVLLCAVDGTRLILPKGAVVPGHPWTTANAAVLGLLHPRDFESPRDMARAAQEQVSQAVQSFQSRLQEAPSP